MRATRTTAAAIACAAALLVGGCGVEDPYADNPSSTPAPSPTTAAGTAAPPITKRRDINRQDTRTKKHRRRESAVMHSRPMLDYLPLTIGEVTIAIHGLAADGRSTLLSIDPGEGSRAHALEVYRDALRAYDDNGHAYKTKVVRP